MVEFMTNGALVLAGGGVAGVAWETGVLLGIQDVELEACARIIGAPTTLIGTSAGSATAAQLAGGTPLETLFDAQLAEETAEIFVEVDFAEFGAMMAGAIGAATSPEDARRRLGRIAIEADTVAPSARMVAISARLPVKTWGERDLRIAAVDAESGELRIFDRNSGVDLVLAVAASCAIPGIWPVVEIDGRVYMDGGMRSLANVDLAAGSDPVLVLVPQTERTPMGASIAPEDLATLAGSRVHVVYADAASIFAFGVNPLDPKIRKPSAEAGRELGRSLATEIARFWG
jgi:NTE family protein